MNGGHPVDREELAELMWDPSEGRDPRHNLRQALVDLRKSLSSCADVVVSDREKLALDPNCYELDADEFHRLNEAGQFEKAVKIYRGEFLRGFNLSAQSYTYWIQLERGRLSAIAGRALEHLAKTHDLAGDGARAAEFAERLVSLEPWREDWQRLLLKIYARHRGRNAAILHARRFVADLKRDIDVLPEPETLALLESIRENAFAPDKVMLAEAL